ncbi:hypothetical protein [Kitasatospora phosalacinea]|uniref:hypothetical protein n=1 Tax=Kitasatospora phosalacinea TaxID=2065 RepID=UPI0005277200|nr:hypothetical protein [Kitasatospora phosalacinea]
MALTDRTVLIPDVERIRTQDPNNHLHCRKSQLLAYVAGSTPWSDLLMYRALGSTAAVYRHCHLRGKDRWAFDTPYVTDGDLRLLGFETLSAGTVGLDRFESELPGLLAAGRPVFFYAPRHHFPHWVEFMRRVGTVAEEHRLLHSFLVCGASGTEVVLLDNTSDDHEYFPLTVGWDVLREGYAQEPERWFVDCSTVLPGPGPGPDLDGFESAYRAFLARFRDGFQLYDLIGENLAAERASADAVYRAPGVNSIALLAGSRVLFSRFLELTRHGGPVRAAYAGVARLATELSEQVNAFHAGTPTLSVDRIRGGLAELRQREQRAAALLTDEAARLPRILPSDPDGR